MRCTLTGGRVAVVTCRADRHPERLDRLKPVSEQLGQWPYYLGAVVGGFVAGHLIKVFPFRHGYVFQTFQAWLSLLAMSAVSPADSPVVAIGPLSECSMPPLIVLPLSVAPLAPPLLAVLSLAELPHAAATTARSITMPTHVRPNCARCFLLLKSVPLHSRRCRRTYGEDVAQRHLPRCMNMKGC